MVNFITGKRYKGKNPDRLASAYPGEKAFCTFLQGIGEGLSLQKGTRGVLLKTFQPKKSKEKDKHGNPKIETIVRSFVVFPKSAWSRKQGRVQ